MSPSELARWTRTEALVGHHCCYFTGRLAGLTPVGRLAQELAAEGLLFLYQRRCPFEPGAWHYCAVRMSRKAGRVFAPRWGEEQT